MISDGNDDVVSFRQYMDEITKRPGKKWFAWRRVNLEDGNTAWFKWVYRELIPVSPIRYYPYYVYRSLEAETLRRLVGTE